MIVLITNTYIPYCYDIVHVFGLPQNFSHRFRYQKKWIKLQKGIDSLKNQDGIVVLRNFDTGDLIPIRYINIENVLQVGDFNYIEFQVGKFSPIENKLIISKAITDELMRNNYQNVGGEELDSLVFEIDTLPGRDAVKEKAEQDKWSDILKEIGELDCYKDVSFLKILQLRDSNGNQAKIEKDRSGNYSFFLSPSSLYFLEVLQHVPSNIDVKESIESPYNVEIKAETDTVEILRKIQKVVGKYDLLRFIFKTAPGYAKKRTFIEVENKQGGSIAQYGLSALFLPILVRPPLWMKWLIGIRIFLGVLGVIALFASGTISCLLPVSSDFVRNMAILVLILASWKWDAAVTAFVKESKDIKL